ncbi:MAG TPA: hypothetical protein VFR18_10425 [Terriglobia bacterium]|nr:hypothetical protein [Terriglobia bacterium]
MFRWFNRKDTPSTPPLGAVTRDLRGDEWHIELDLTPQVLKLSIPEDTGWQESDELAPTLRDLMRRGFKESRFISASMLALKAKLFDDGLYAAAEVAMQPAKATLLTRLLNSTPVIDAAARLGGMDIPNSPDVDRITQEFLDNDLESKPIGFYTWNDELRRIFQQDRLLGRRLESRDIAALTGALDADPSAKAAYLSHLSTVSRLTNPADAATPGLFSSGGACFFPPSRSYESDLIQRVYGERPIPDGFSLAQEIVNRVRDGSLNFDPAEKSGWYDFQTWALEPLIVPERMPEAARLRTNDRYRQQLEELFKAVLSLTRETHLKVVKIPMVGAAMPFWQEQRVAVDVEPELTVEPLRTYYERRAKTYEFVRSILECIGPCEPSLRPDHPHVRLMKTWQT